jgi:5-methyltetrahydrofolate--homocysteine methyltransferase
MNPMQLETVVRNLAGSAKVPVLAKPNAGLPVFDASGAASYDMDAETFAKGMAVLYRDGASLLGGCCGTDPDFIRAMKKQLKQ